MAFNVAIAEFNRVDFVDRWGQTRTIAGCSLVGREEFFQRIRELCDRMNDAHENEEWEQFHERDERTRFLVRRCLELNGLDPDWVNLSMVYELLFSRKGETEEEPKQGWLVELNLPRKPATDGKAASIEEMIAALSSSTQGLIEAFTMARSPEYPANELIEVLEARAEQQKAAEPKGKPKLSAQDAEIARKRLEENLAKMPRQSDGEAIAMSSREVSLAEVLKKGQSS